MTNLTYTITLEDIGALLHTIRYNKSLPLSSVYDYLASLNIISNDMPALLRDYHVSTWLIQIILSEYARARQIHHLDPVALSTDKRQLLQQIHEDYRMFDKDLEAWSVLFVRYVYHITTHEHEEVAQMTGRTLRRRQKRGLELLYVQILLN